jgi:hypothetical protein
MRVDDLGACFWGFNTPGCFVFARVLPSGRVIIRADLKFVRLPVAAVATQVLARATALGIDSFRAIYGNPEMFPSTTKTASSTLEPEAPSSMFGRAGLPMIPSGSNRIHGWARVHEFLRDAPDGVPWLQINKAECPSLVRTLPTLIQKENDPDDCEGETFAAEALRVLLSSRPAPSVRVVLKAPYPPYTVGWLRELDDADARKGKSGVLGR